MKYFTKLSEKNIPSKEEFTKKYKGYLENRAFKEYSGRRAALQALGGVMGLVGGIERASQGRGSRLITPAVLSAVGAGAGTAVDSIIRKSHGSVPQKSVDKAVDYQYHRYERAKGARKDKLGGKIKRDYELYSKSQPMKLPVPSKKELDTIYKEYLTRKATKNDKSLPLFLATVGAGLGVLDATTRGRGPSTNNVLLPLAGAASGYAGGYVADRYGKGVRRQQLMNYPQGAGLKIKDLYDKYEAATGKEKADLGKKLIDMYGTYKYS